MSVDPDYIICSEKLKRAYDALLRGGEERMGGTMSNPGLSGLILDKDVQLLISEGFLTTSLNLTTDGTIALLNLVFKEKKTALIAMAKKQKASRKSR